MPIPSKPYCTTAQVALLLPALLNKNTDFDEINTTPKKSAVTQYSTWVSNQIDLQFQMAGYMVPFQELTDEAWPTHQTHYLELLAALGVAALTGGHVLKPAPAVTPGRGNSSGNIFQDMYNTELRKIWDGTNSFIRFRCRFYSGTPAEKSMVEPTGPGLDYMMGKMNPEDFLMFEDYTFLKKSIVDYVTDNFNISSFNLNNFHSMFDDKLESYTYA